MSALQWTSEHAIFVPSLDAEHKGVFEAMEELRQAVEQGGLNPEAQTILKTLVSRAASHFSHEERLMRAASYPGYEWHKRQHDTAKKKVQQLSGRVERGETAAVSELLEFMNGWLRDHTGLHDRMMAAYLRNFNRSRGRSVS